MFCLSPEMISSGHWSVVSPLTELFILCERELKNFMFHFLPLNKKIKIVYV